MTLTIIAGTHTFIDLTGRFRKAFAQSMQQRIHYNIDGLNFTKRRFERVEITKEGEVIRLPARIFPLDKNGLFWSVSQPTGSCKTILLAYDLKKTHERGGNTTGNLSLKWMEHNKGKSPEEWKPGVSSIEDLIKAKNCKFAIDDLKGTIDRWQAKEADIVGMTANLGRKDSVDLVISSQGVTNYVPPNIRRVATGYEIPYCTIRDQRLFSPDGKGFPREIEVLALIPGDSQIGDVFVGFGMLNGDIPDGKIVTPTKELLESYKTMEIAVSLKVDAESDEARPNQSGYPFEEEFEAALIEKVPEQEWHHENGKKTFDFIPPKPCIYNYAFDLKQADSSGIIDLRNKDKKETDLKEHILVQNSKLWRGFIVTTHAEEWAFIPITSKLNLKVKHGKLHLKDYINSIQRWNQVFLPKQITPMVTI